MPIFSTCTQLITLMRYYNDITGQPQVFQKRRYTYEAAEYAATRHVLAYSPHFDSSP